MYRLKQQALSNSVRLQKQTEKTNVLADVSVGSPGNIFIYLES